MGNVIRTPTVQMQQKPVAAPVSPPAPPSSPAAPAHIDSQALTERDSERLRQAAREQGFEQGYRQGQEQARRETEEQIQRLREVLAAVMRDQEQAVAATEQLVLPVLMAALAKLLGASMPDARAVRHVIEGALGEISIANVLAIHLHPRDAAVLLPSGQSTFTAACGRTLTIVADPGITGGCVIKTTFGDLDAQWTTQLAVLKRALQQGGV